MSANSQAAERGIDGQKSNATMTCQMECQKECQIELSEHLNRSDKSLAARNVRISVRWWASDEVKNFYF